MFFFYVLPWKDCAAYKKLTENSNFLIDEINLERKKHSYFNIATHAYDEAPFNSVLILIGTELAKAAWSKEISSQITEFFTRTKVHTEKPTEKQNQPHTAAQDQ